MPLAQGHARRRYRRNQDLLAKRERMPTIKVPTLKQFKSLTGRSGIGKVFKTKNDLDQIFAALKIHDAAGQGMHDGAIAALRRIRRECIAWLLNHTNQRASHAAVQQLLESSNLRFLAVMEFKHFGEQQSTNAPAPAIKPVPNLPFGRELTGNDVKRVGNSMGQNLANETGPRHWGPNVDNRMRQWYGNYVAAGGTLSIGAWADYILPANAEDDPSGMFLGGTALPNLPSIRERAEGVKYCTPSERAAYKISIQGGKLFDANGTLYDTSGRETHFSKYGWAIFVLGFDNILYSNSHLVNLFHHSSFFASDPVQCAGEICCIGGKVRFLTPKTGHYRSSKANFYRLLSFLSYHEVTLANVLACPAPHQHPNYWLGTEVFAANGDEPTSAPVLTNHPPQLTAPGIPSWPIPPMTI
ncbi:hypothetical protein NHH03_18810 [Stieleria sp. TO1_6]|uniref:hypothetical protein n=1 Tax=Stieleria tagensis TaxID=2956795 RepID=UPI00209B20B7|nr:hypothetical protein [Stieleria tagensis]MCO8123803.1 hypothetical protein [Stieleria tagensis]